jgi:hypothetical protein
MSVGRGSYELSKYIVYYSVMVGQISVKVILLVHTLVKFLIHVTEQKLNDFFFWAKIKLTPYYQYTSQPLLRS